jgi:anti-sigma regulatory factor (Ser/Thr protein kinase)/serine/threonine protein phosphatase PrpC
VTQPPEQNLDVTHTSDVAAARRAVLAYAAELGFDASECEELALVVVELASNLVKHAGGGKLVFLSLNESGRAGIQIEATDQGPGIADIEEALRDGFSTSGSLGYGLGVVNRFMDRLEISSQVGQGTLIVCQRCFRNKSAPAASCPLAVGVASRPHPKETVNGDAFIVKHWGKQIQAGVIDGLGHGAAAHKAAQTARQYVENHFDQPPDQIFLGVGRSCRSTRGVVMALARFDWERETVTFASIGNIEARVFGNMEPIDLILRRGVLGGNAPQPAISQYHWEPNYILILHSDGLSSRWGWEDIKDLANQQASEMASALLSRFAKEDDDATVVVVRNKVS